MRKSSSWWSFCLDLPQCVLISVLKLSWKLKLPNSSNNTSKYLSMGSGKEGVSSLQILIFTVYLDPWFYIRMGRMQISYILNDIVIYYKHLQLETHWQVYHINKINSERTLHQFKFRTNHPEKKNKTLLLKP